MRHYLNLVSISNKVHHRQSRMTRICIVLAVFLVAVMFGLADMYLKSMTDETRHQTGDWHCKITAIDEKTSEYIAARPEIDLSGWQHSRRNRLHSVRSARFCCRDGRDNIF